MSQILYAQSVGELRTDSEVWAPIKDLQLLLPAATPSTKNALITLNVPSPRAEDDNFPCGMFAISVDDIIDTNYPTACFSYESKKPQSPARVPTTLVIQVKLTKKKQMIKAVWRRQPGLDRYCTVILDSPSTLSAIIP